MFSLLRRIASLLMVDPTIVPLVCSGSVRVITTKGMDVNQIRQTGGFVGTVGITGGEIHECKC